MPLPSSSTKNSRPRKKWSEIVDTTHQLDAVPEDKQLLDMNLRSFYDPDGCRILYDALCLDMTRLSLELADLVPDEGSMRVFWYKTSHRRRVCTHRITSIQLELALLEEAYPWILSERSTLD